MARAFSEKERIMIKELIIKNAIELFLKYGFKKTSMDDLVKDLPIAKSSFYNFFASKEDLFVEIVKKEELLFKDNLINQSFFNKENNIEESIKGMINYTLNEVESNSIWNKLTSDIDKSSLLYKKLVDENGKYKYDYSWDFILEKFSYWKKKGLIIDEDHKLLAHIIRSIFFISKFKNEFGKKYYKKVINFLLNTIANAIVK